MHPNGGLIDVPTLSENGDISSYDYATIPAANDAGWSLAPVDGAGKVLFEPVSIVNDCLEEVDFTYFQTFVTIPGGSVITTFNVYFYQLDDGARVYVFNSDHPAGAHVPGTELKFASPGNTTGDISSLIKAGEEKPDRCCSGG